ncbi:MAG TPA: MotA/TolQ/ExbB proton channel family protein [Azospirillum sp.]|nr:MotA/TolQ/ExbB proton channel family protein [Azospirillum sp.]
MTATRETSQDLRGPELRAQRTAATVERAAASPARARPRGRLDAATLVGLGAAAGVILVAMAAGGSLRAFLDPPSLLIVLGGTLAVTTASYSLGDVAAAWGNAGRILVQTSYDPRAVARQVMLLAEAARRAGPEMLKSMLPELKGEPFLHRCVSLITEGPPADDVERMLTAEVEAFAAARAKSAAVLRRASEVAPAMGLIGTLVGLVQMLGGLSDPSTIGPAMALALLTTFYGAVLGNVVLAPLAAKLERNAEDEALVKTLYTIGAVSIARQENPRRLEMLLNTLLPPGRRLQYFDKESPRGA